MRNYSKFVSVRLKKKFTDGAQWTKTNDVNS